jgi:hypothetical protein
LFIAEVGGGPPLRIQVKTGTSSTAKDKVEGPIYLWDTGYSVIEQIDESLWYAYVWLNGWPQKPNLPEVFFVPSQVVVKCIQSEQDAKKKRPFFWMRVQDAEAYKGVQGLTKMRAAMTPGLQT